MLIPRVIAAAVDKVARQTIGREWGLYATLIDHWAEIVGEDYAKVTSPVKITFPKGRQQGGNLLKNNKKDGILHIRLPQGLAMEFSFRTSQIQQRVNAFFGYDAIMRIALEPFYGAPPGPAASTSGSRPTKEETPLPNETAIEAIEEEELRVAVRRLGKAIFQDEKTT